MLTINFRSVCSLLFTPVFIVFFISDVKINFYLLNTTYLKFTVSHNKWWFLQPLLLRGPNTWRDTWYMLVHSPASTSLWMSSNFINTLADFFTKTDDKAGHISVYRFLTNFTALFNLKRIKVWEFTLKN